MSKSSKLPDYGTVVQQNEASSAVKLPTEREADAVPVKEEVEHDELPDWFAALSATMMFGTFALMGAMQLWEDHKATQTATMVQTELLLHKAEFKPTNFELSCSEGKIFIVKNTTQGKVPLKASCPLKEDVPQYPLASVVYQQATPKVEVQHQYDAQVRALVESGGLVATLKQ